MGIKQINEICKLRNLSIIYNRKHQLCGFRTFDYGGL